MKLYRWLFPAVVLGSCTTSEPTDHRHSVENDTALTTITENIQDSIIAFNLDSMFLGLVSSKEIKEHILEPTYKVPNLWNAAKTIYYSKTNRREIQYLKDNKINTAKGAACALGTILSYARGLGDESDALRHCIFSSCVGLAVGPAEGAKILANHESETNPDQMDMQNNSVGLEIAKRITENGGGLNNISDAIGECKKALSDGKLRVDKPNSKPSSPGTTPAPSPSKPTPSPSTPSQPRGRQEREPHSRTNREPNREPKEPEARGHQGPAGGR